MNCSAAGGVTLCFVCVTGVETEFEKSWAQAIPLHYILLNSSLVFTKYLSVVLFRLYRSQSNYRKQEGQIFCGEIQVNKLLVKKSKNLYSVLSSASNKTLTVLFKILYIVTSFSSNYLLISARQVNKTRPSFCTLEPLRLLNSLVSNI